MRFQFVLAALAASTQAISLNDLPEPLTQAELELETSTHTIAEIEAEADAALDALVTSLIQSHLGATGELEASADAEAVSKTMAALQSLKAKILAKIKTMNKPTMGGIMTLVGDVVNTAVKGGKVLANPGPIEIGMFAKQLYDDWQHLKQGAAYMKGKK